MSIKKEFRKCAAAICIVSQRWAARPGVRQAQRRAIGSGCFRRTQCAPCFWRRGFGCDMECEQMMMSGFVRDGTAQGNSIDLRACLAWDRCSTIQY